jgi:hypothetical protein
MRQSRWAKRPSGVAVNAIQEYNELMTLRHSLIESVCLKDYFILSGGSFQERWPGCIAFTPGAGRRKLQDIFDECGFGQSRPMPRKDLRSGSFRF